MTTSIKNKRHKERCQAYRASGTREKNKAKRIKKHLVRFPNDAKAEERLDAKAEERLQALPR